MYSSSPSPLLSYFRNSASMTSSVGAMLNWFIAITNSSLSTPPLPSRSKYLNHVRAPRNPFSSVIAFSLSSSSSSRTV